MDRGRRRERETAVNHESRAARVGVSSSGAPSCEIAGPGAWVLGAALEEKRRGRSRDATALEMVAW